MENQSNIAEYLRTNRIVHLATVTDNGGASVRAMYMADISDDLIVTFGTATNSTKVAEIRANKKVSLSSFEKGTSFRAFGEAEIIEDQQLKNQLWEDDWTHYFPGGPTDPNFTLIRIHIKQAEFTPMG